MPQDSRPQSARTILMVRPASFGFNAQTAGTNLFQRRPAGLDGARLQTRALGEFDGLVRRLRLAGVEVIVVEDRPQPATPDAVFPNNWFSLHPDGTVVFYPMYAPLRRLERRNDIVETLHALYGFRISRVLDLSGHESGARFLEGTGSMVYDHPNRSVYANISARTHPELVDELASELKYEPIVFHAADRSGAEIYHTNVMLSVGTRFAVVCAASIADAGERASVLDRLRDTGRELVLIDFEQMWEFAGNGLELETRAGSRILAMSTRACRSFRPDQIAALELHVELVPAPIPTIETVGGGSVRCMIAEVLLPRS